MEPKMQFLEETKIGLEVLDNKQLNKVEHELGVGGFQVLEGYIKVFMTC